LIKYGVKKSAHKGGGIVQSVKYKHQKVINRDIAIIIQNPQCRFAEVRYRTIKQQHIKNGAI